jgi:hypothetical protein
LAASRTASAFEAATGSNTAVRSHRDTAADRVSVRPCDRAARRHAAARTFDYATVDIKVIALEVAAVDAPHPFIGREPQKTVQLPAVRLIEITCAAEIVAAEIIAAAEFIRAEVPAGSAGVEPVRAV